MIFEKWFNAPLQALNLNLHEMKVINYLNIYQMLFVFLIIPK